ncbi:hypothetical protein F8M41_020759 [Gigaspora margarita]|uniref:Uncharacterized protein n=1 Tax=Gigaspora margarita TaxID=4874 RepID=A0A8H4EJG2_GIGMA|nr:hypothetical protein F8M41_020759 [Gigaspora margarita]
MKGRKKYCVLAPVYNPIYRKSTFCASYICYAKSFPKVPEYASLAAKVKAIVCKWALEEDVVQKYPEEKYIKKYKIIEARREEKSRVKKDEKDNKPNENDNEEYDDDKTIVDKKDSKKEKNIKQPTGKRT